MYNLKTALWKNVTNSIIVLLTLCSTETHLFLLGLFCFFALLQHIYYDKEHITS